jgi:parallel beta-helix repeat protein
LNGKEAAITILPIAKGGTGANTVTGAVQNLAPAANANPGFVHGFDSGFVNSGYTTIAQLAAAAYVAVPPPGGKKYATVVIGTADAGYTAKDVDILVPAGSTNCISQLNAALAAIPTAGGKILLLNGTYTYGSPWIIERNNITVGGVGASTVLNMNGTKNTTDSAAAAKSNNAVIYLNGNGNIIRDLSVTTPNTTGICYGVYFNSSSNNIITGNAFNNSANSTSFGVYFNSSSNNIITGNAFNNSSNSVSYGVYLSYSSSSSITGNIMSSSGDGSYGVSLAGAMNNSITGNVMSNSGNTNYGVSLSVSNNNSITGNIMSNSGDGSGKTSFGVYLSSSINNSITGNVMSNSGSKSLGISLMSSSSNNAIAGNTLCGKTAAFTGFALHISGSNVTYNQFINNNFRNWTQYCTGAFTTNATAAETLPGSATTIAAFSSTVGTTNVAGFNIV